MTAADSAMTGHMRHFDLVGAVLAFLLIACSASQRPETTPVPLPQSSAASASPVDAFVGVWEDAEIDPAKPGMFVEIKVDGTFVLGALRAVDSTYDVENPKAAVSEGELVIDDGGDCTHAVRALADGSDQTSILGAWKCTQTKSN